MEIFLKILSVILIGIFELLAAIPMGLALGLPPIWVGVSSIAGAIIGAIGIIFLGENVRNWILRIHGKRSNNSGRTSDSKIYRIWNRYGVIGLGLLSPLIMGIPLGVALGVVFGAPRKSLMVWSSLGAIIWGLGLTFGITMGITGIELLLKNGLHR